MKFTSYQDNYKSKKRQIKEKTSGCDEILTPLFFVMFQKVRNT